MKDDNKFQLFMKHAEQPFSGWDFSFISDTERVRSEPLSWSYGSIVVSLIHEAKSMLDMGTGGGELLSKLGPYPPLVYATEAYRPNVPIAKKRLSPLNIQVFQINDDEKLPFEKGTFDLIINKHESFSAKEVRRIITKDGFFLTQQVGGHDCNGINEMLGVPINDEYKDWNLEHALKDLEENGFDILKGMEEYPVQRFYDIGALIYYLKAIPWQVPNFNPEMYMDKLYQIHCMIEQTGFFDVKQHRFIILAKAK